MEQYSLSTCSSIFICICKQYLESDKINHVILANNSCCFQKQMKIELQVERLYTKSWDDPWERIMQKESYNLPHTRNIMSKCLKIIYWRYDYTYLYISNSYIISFISRNIKYWIPIICRIKFQNYISVELVTDFSHRCMLK